ncbi:MAG: hypothetical protein IPP77_14285 [Bacteroidetes bacterium]|nr:hypothetical protein [Bacteroidota bacterium]
MKGLSTLFKGLLALVACCFLTAPLMATHIMGSDISYRCLGGNQYQIVVTLYRDCSGVAVTNTIPVDVLSSCGNSSVTLTLDQNQSGQEVSQLCPTYLSTCRGGSYPGCSAIRM